MNNSITFSKTLPIASLVSKDVVVETPRLTLASDLYALGAYLYLASQESEVYPHVARFEDRAVKDIRNYRGQMVLQLA